jgi:hypothetical protein
MIGMERNRMNYAQISKTQRESALAEQWQKQSTDNKMMMQAKKNPLQQLQQKQISQQPALSKLDRIQSVQGIESVDDVNSVNGIDADMSLQNRVDFQNASHFNLQQDIVDFIKPTALRQEYVRKDVLIKTSHNILAHLEVAGASEALMKRAKALLEEENNVKSVTDAYRNALIFA